jgi:pyridoxine 4-dehydrogenase
VKIHQFAPGRKDRNIDIEVTVRAIDEYVKAGKIGGVGLSEVSASTLRRAAKITKITSVEVAVSLWDTDPLTNGLAEACAELDIPILAYCQSPNIFFPTSRG